MFGLNTSDVTNLYIQTYMQPVVRIYIYSTLFFNNRPSGETSTNNATFIFQHQLLLFYELALNTGHGQDQLPLFSTYVS